MLASCPFCQAPFDLPSENTPRVVQCYACGQIGAPASGTAPSPAPGTPEGARAAPLPALRKPPVRRAPPRAESPLAGLEAGAKARPAESVASLRRFRLGASALPRVLQFYGDLIPPRLRATSQAVQAGVILGSPLLLFVLAWMLVGGRAVLNLSLFFSAILSVLMLSTSGYLLAAALRRPRIEAAQAEERPSSPLSSPRLGFAVGLGLLFASWLPLTAGGMLVAQVDPRYYRELTRMLPGSTPMAQNYVPLPQPIPAPQFAPPQSAQPEVVLPQPESPEPKAAPSKPPQPVKPRSMRGKIVYEPNRSDVREFIEPDSLRQEIQRVLETELGKENYQPGEGIVMIVCQPTSSVPFNVSFGGVLIPYRDKLREKMFNLVSATRGAKLNAGGEYCFTIK